MSLLAGVEPASNCYHKPLDLKVGSERKQLALLISDLELLYH